MEQEIIRSLSPDLECIRCRLKTRQIIFEVQSARRQVPCPYCGTFSSKVHSVYQREIQDIPLQDRQTILLLNDYSGQLAHALKRVQRMGSAV